MTMYLLQLVVHSALMLLEVLSTALDMQAQPDLSAAEVPWCIPRGFACGYLYLSPLHVGQKYDMPLTRHRI